jgi:hypothetical protein
VDLPDSSDVAVFTRARSGPHGGRQAALSPLDESVGSEPAAAPAPRPVQAALSPLDDSVGSHPAAAPAAILVGEIAARNLARA